MLIRSGADISKASSDGLTPLHYASLEGFHRIARMLLRNGADTRIMDANGKSPLDLVKSEKRENFTKMFSRLRE